MVKKNKMKLHKKKIKIIAETMFMYIGFMSMIITIIYNLLNNGYNQRIA